MTVAASTMVAIAVVVAVAVQHTLNRRDAVCMEDTARRELVALLGEHGRSRHVRLQWWRSGQHCFTVKPRRQTCQQWLV
jgi:hypothetical protein